MSGHVPKPWCSFLQCGEPVAYVTPELYSGFGMELSRQVSFWGNQLVLRTGRAFRPLCPVWKQAELWVWIVRKCFSDTCANIIQTPSVYRSIGSIIQACSLSHRTGMSWKLWLYLGPLLPAALQEGSQARFVCRVCLFFRQWPHRVCLPVSDRWCFSSSTYVWGEGSGNGIQTKGLPKVKKGLLYVVSEVSSCFLLLLFLLLMAFLLCRDFVYVSQDPKDQLLLG